MEKPQEKTFTRNGFSFTPKAYGSEEVQWPELPRFTWVRTRGIDFLRMNDVARYRQGEHIQVFGGRNTFYLTEDQKIVEMVLLHNIRGKKEDLIEDLLRTSIIGPLLYLGVEAQHVEVSKKLNQWGYPKVKIYLRAPLTEDIIQEFETFRGELDAHRHLLADCRNARFWINDIFASVRTTEERLRRLELREVTDWLTDSEKAELGLS